MQNLAIRLAAALASLDGTSKLAMVCVFFGWFLMSTVVVSLGSFKHQVRFFDLSAVIADPTRLLIGVDAPLQQLVFALICAACLCAPLWPHLDRRRMAWLGYLAPLALMLVCAGLLYSKTSGEMFVDSARADSLTHSVIRFANDMARRGGGYVAQHISVGAGAYLALIGCGVLSVQGWRYRTRRNLSRLLREE